MNAQEIQIKNDLLQHRLISFFVALATTFSLKLLKALLILMYAALRAIPPYLFPPPAFS